MEPGALFIVRLHPLPSMNVLMVVSSLMALLTQGHTTVKGTGYCQVLYHTECINIFIYGTI